MCDVGCGCGYLYRGFVCFICWFGVGCGVLVD